MIMKMKKITGKIAMKKMRMMWMRKLMIMSRIIHSTTTAIPFKINILNQFIKNLLFLRIQTLTAALLIPTPLLLALHNFQSLARNKRKPISTILQVFSHIYLSQIKLFIRIIQFLLGKITIQITFSKNKIL